MTMPSLDPSSNQGGAPLPPGPPPWYWTARGMDEDRTQTSRRLVQGIDVAIDDFGTRLETLQRALGLTRNPDVQARLMAYYAKPDTYQEAFTMLQQGLIKVLYSWETQEAYFPEDYQEDWDDFQKLRIRARAGDFGPVMQAQELAYEMGVAGEELP